MGTKTTLVRASLIALPEGERIPRAVPRITWISERMMRDHIRLFFCLAAASLTVPAVIHRLVPVSGPWRGSGERPSRSSDIIAFEADSMSRAYVLIRLLYRFAAPEEWLLWRVPASRSQPM